ncbi:MAG: hypothetical protein P9M00_04110 [Candidatus Tritonobacter lacicola]|nr:hypothetical protein [Candidatus Tritonobacter lacicola]
MIYEIEDTVRLPDTEEDVLSVIAEAIREQQVTIVSRTDNSLEFSIPSLQYNSRALSCVSAGIISLGTEEGHRSVRYRLSLVIIILLVAAWVLFLIGRYIWYKGI